LPVIGRATDALDSAETTFQDPGAMGSRTKAPLAAAPAAEAAPTAKAANGQTNLADLLSRPATRAAAGAADGTVVSGHLVGVDGEGRLQFVPEGSVGGPVPVAIGIELSDGALVKAARMQRRALVVRTADANPRWVLIGLVRERVGVKARDARPGQLEVTLDGETLRLSAERNLELRCGAASLLLRKDGKVVITGTNVVSSSRGQNRIRGATISLN
jgi:hypothetical protein